MPDSTKDVLDAAYALAAAYAHGPAAAQNALPALMEALKEHDEDRYREAFAEGVNLNQDEQAK